MSLLRKFVEIVTGGIAGETVVLAEKRCAVERIAPLTASLVREVESARRHPHVHGADQPFGDPEAIALWDSVEAELSALAKGGAR